MRIQVSIPPFSADATTKARFAKTLAEFSKEVGVEVGIDSVHVKAVGHTWEFRTEDEFDKASKLPEVIDALYIFFSDENRGLSGLLYLTPDGGNGSWEGPERLAVPLQTVIDKFVSEEYRKSLSAKAKKPSSNADETIPVPHCELDPDGLRSLVAAILMPEESEDVQIQRLEFSVSGGTLTLNEENLERILDNPAIPSPFDEFAVTGRGGRARIAVSLARLRRSRVQIQGPLSWVRAKKMRLQNFFSQHPNSDPLARSRLVGAGFILLFVCGSFLLVGLTLNRLVWHDDPSRVLGLAVFFGLLVGAPMQSWVLDSTISRCWVATSPRHKSFFRSIGGVIGGLIMSELAYILLGVAVGWLVAQP